MLYIDHYCPGKFKEIEFHSLCDQLSFQPVTLYSPIN